MRAKQFLKEASFNPDIYSVLVDKGYKKIGQGQDQQVYLEPGTNLVLKIFGTVSTSDGIQLSKAQKTFVTFADYCKQHPNNPFLPNFTGWETFVFEGQTYLQIRMERLFGFSAKDNWGDELAIMADGVRHGGTKDQYIRSNVDNAGDEMWDQAQSLLAYLGEDSFNTLWDTIKDLSKIAKQKGYVLDLHDENFMLGSDGHIVISDPFFVGWGKDK